MTGKHTQEKRNKYIKLWKNFTKGLRRNTYFPLDTSLKVGQSSPTNVIQRLVLKHLTQMGCSIPRDFVSHRLSPCICCSSTMRCMRSNPVGSQKAQFREHSTLPATKPPKSPSEKLKHYWTVEQMGKISFPLEMKSTCTLEVEFISTRIRFYASFSPK